MKKLMYIGAVLASAGVLGLGVLAYAQGVPGMPPSPNASGTPMLQGRQGGQGMQGRHSAPPIVISVDVNGHALVRGTLLSVSGTTLTIQSWGMSFTVDASNAQFVGNATSVSAFAVGDIIGVQGTLSESNTGVITATTVRDWGSAQDVGTVNGLNSNGSPTLGMPNNPGFGQQGGGNNPGGFGMPPGPNTSGTPGMFGPNASGTPGMPPGFNASGAPGMQGGQGPQGEQGLQQRLQMLLQQLNQLRGQLPPQQGQPTSTGQ